MNSLVQVHGGCVSDLLRVTFANSGVTTTNGSMLLFLLLYVENTVQKQPLKHKMTNLNLIYDDLTIRDIVDVVLFCIIHRKWS